MQERLQIGSHSTRRTASITSERLFHLWDAGSSRYRYFAVDPFRRTIHRLLSIVFLLLLVMLLIVLVLILLVDVILLFYFIVLDSGSRFFTYLNNHLIFIN
jgi:hypothetical protein